MQSTNLTKQYNGFAEQMIKTEYNFRLMYHYRMFLTKSLLIFSSTTKRYIFYIQIYFKYSTVSHLSYSQNVTISISKLSLDAVP